MSTASENELNNSCETLLAQIMNGDRHPIEDAEQVDIVCDMDIEAVHTYRGHTITLRWQLYNGWHDSNGPMKELDPFEVELGSD